MHGWPDLKEYKYGWTPLDNSVHANARKLPFIVIILKNIESIDVLQYILLSKSVLRNKSHYITSDKGMIPAGYSWFIYLLYSLILFTNIHDSIKELEFTTKFNQVSQYHLKVTGSKTQSKPVFQKKYKKQTKYVKVRN